MTPLPHTPSITYSTIKWVTKKIQLDLIYENCENMRFYDICWSPELSMFCAIMQYYKFHNWGEQNIFTSSDGITWIETTLPINDYWQNICWSPELRIFCAIANNTNKAITSSDGITWTERTLPINIHNYINICWSPKLRMFCVVGEINDNNALFGIPE